MLPVKFARVVIDEEPLANSNTVPSPALPPCDVVPKRSPAASSIRPAYGFAPLLPVKFARVVSVASESVTACVSAVIAPVTVYPVHVRIRKSSGKMMRKLSVTESQ